MNHRPRRTRFVVWLTLALAVAFVPVPLQFASAQSLPGASNLARAAAAGLPVIEDGPLRLAHSASATDVAERFRKDLVAAINWYRAETGWSAETVRIAILDHGDYTRITGIPYPTPHAETRTGFIILADDIRAHPGFELWDLDAGAVNMAWAFHEIGHVIADDLGIRAGSAWVNELIANVLMAAYVRAERPEFAGYQSGMPPRFATAGVYTRLADLDRIYFAMGQLNYLWFHFQLAHLADVMTANAEIATLLAALRREFPMETGRVPIPIAETFARLERVSPGVTAAAGPLAE